MRKPAVVIAVPLLAAASIVIAIAIRESLKSSDVVTKSQGISDRQPSTNPNLPNGGTKADTLPSAFMPSAPDELSPLDIMKAWDDAAPDLQLAPDDAATIHSYLLHILSRTHRRIDQASRDGFRDSLRNFVANSRADFSTPVNRGKGVDLLKFCIYVGWAPSEDNHEALSYFSGLIDKILKDAKEKIDSSIPPEKGGKWQPQVADDIADLRLRIDKQTGQLCRDFLFPAFKQRLSPLEESEVLRQIDSSSIIPKYGPTEHMMMTPDEEFGVQLKKFADYFTMFYFGSVTARQAASARGVSSYWNRYSMTLSQSIGTWPAIPTLYKPPGSQPSTRAN